MDNLVDGDIAFLKIEEFIEEWSNRNNCDISRRHPLRRMIRLAESSAVAAYIDDAVRRTLLSAEFLEEFAAALAVYQIPYPATLTDDRELYAVLRKASRVPPTPEGFHTNDISCESPIGDDCIVTAREIHTEDSSP